MRRLSAAVLSGILIFTGALTAQADTTRHCTGGGSVTGQGQTIHVHEECDRGGSSQGNDGNNGTSSNGNSSSGNSSSGNTSTGPRTYTMAEVIEICRRGPYGDALSIECMAAYNDRIREEGDEEPDAPAEPPAVTIARARVSAFAQLEMDAPEIGASPCLTATGACRGTVGVPVWLWVGDGDGSLPSRSVTATAGGYSITATARVTKVKWSLGDGQTTTCTSTGTRYSASTHGWSDPDCGFASGWTSSGSHTLTATYVWEITWTGADTGATTHEYSSTEQVEVGELQSVVTRG